MKGKYLVLMLFLFFTGASLGASSKFYEKEVVFPVDADSIAKIDMASRLVPSAKQLAWQQLEMTAFLHFGVNTFTDREWGDGTESPSIFNPEKLDAEQWVSVLKDAGFKLVILTAKHHDGFCLWPTKTTKHSVAASPWKGGKGDVVSDLRRACDKYGMKMGVYLSPWDRNAECYGDSPRYNDMFVAQLTELLTNYGRIDEVWFDGACGEGPNGKKQEYDWTRFKTVIKTLQPDAVVAIMGDDVRWVGNEKGLGRETEWSATALMPGIHAGSDAYNKKLGLFSKAKDLGGRGIVARADRLFWWPSEVDVSIRPGWFFHEKEQPRTLHELANIYLNSVGRNSVLLLNVPPNKDGLINPDDCARLQELHRWISDNLSNPIPVDKKNNLSVEFRKSHKVNCVLMQENISKGQRVESFNVLGRKDGQWKKLAEGTTIGYKRILTFNEVEVDAVKVEIFSSRGDVELTAIDVFKIEMPSEDGVSNANFVKKAGWKIVDATVCGSKEAAYTAIDGLASTSWRSTAGKMPCELVVDMGTEQLVAGFAYLPNQGDDKQGTVFNYRFSVSTDGKSWTECKTSGEFSNIANNPIEQKVYFEEPLKARYFRFTCLSEIEGRDFVTVGELSIIAPSGN